MKKLIIPSNLIETDSTILKSMVSYDFIPIIIRCNY